MTHYNAPDGTRLAYRDEGDGRPLICLAGLTRNASDFDYLMPHLPPLRVIRPDYRGRGGSAWADPATYSLPVEAQDVLALMDHLGLERAAILGTSRGGLIAMALAAGVKDRLTGVCLNDIGPEIATEGLDVIKGYVGKDPRQSTYADAAAARAHVMAEFRNVPESRWLEEVKKHFVETPEGLKINYDPRLAEIFNRETGDAAPPGLWDLFEALQGLPLAAIRGANSNLLTAGTFAEMQRRRPDMIAATVSDRGHVPFLDEPEAVAAIRAWLERLP